MKVAHLTTPSSFVVILSIAAVGPACSDAATPANGDTVGTAGAAVSGSSGASAMATGTTTSSGGQTTTGGAATGGGTPQTPTGSSTSNAGMTAAGGTMVGTAGAATAGSSMGGTSTGDAGSGGAATAGASMGGSGGEDSQPGGAGGAGGTGAGGVFTGTCTASEDTGGSVSGTGPHDVVIETNSDDGIRCGTIFRPADLGGAEKYPIFVWGEGGCSQDGLSNQAAMGEIASWGYFIVADGTPGGDNACQGGQSGDAFLDYITWAIAENDKPCSAYYQSLDTSAIAADGFSCGGLMAENVAGDPRFTAIGITSSGLMGPNNALWDSMHAPFKIMNGGSGDIAYENGLNDYDAIAMRGIPILYFAKTSAGHGGDLGQGRGDFNLVNLAWLNWQLKGDEGATGKAFLIGASCEFCNDGGWEFKSANIQ